MGWRAAILVITGASGCGIVLVEREQDEREARLRGRRAQPELVYPQMQNWVAYLRGQADALGLDRIDTSRATISISLAQLRGIVESLRAQRRLENRGRLVVICDLPGSGKTTYAKALATKILSRTFLSRGPDSAAGIYLWDAAARTQFEPCQWQLARSFLLQGRTAIIKWGTWGWSEREALRLGAWALGASVELHYLDLPVDTLFERLRARKLESPGISLDDLRTWPEAFERPSQEEIALFGAAVIASA